MTKQTIGIGATANDGTGDVLRAAFSKTNDNFSELYNYLGGTLTGGGVLNGTEKFNGSDGGVPKYWGADAFTVYVQAHANNWSNSQTLNGIGAGAERAMLIATDSGYAGFLAFYTGATLKWTFAKNASEDLIVQNATLGTLLTFSNSTGTAAFTRNLTVERTGQASTASVNINVDTGQQANISFFTAGSLRAYFGKTSTAEIGSNAGSNVAMNMCDDSGTLIGAALTVTRSNREINFGAGLSIGGSQIIDSSRNVRLRSYTVATLPTVGTANRLVAVSDASSPTYNATVAGGGSTRIPAFDNGTNWTCH